MNYTGKFNFHGGDVQGHSIDKIPAKAKKIDNKPVAFGEISGHCHILTGDVQLFEDKDGGVYLAVGSDGAFHQHMRETDISPDTYKANENISTADHKKDCWIAPGNYAIGIHQGYDYFEDIFKQVKD